MELSGKAELSQYDLDSFLIPALAVTIFLEVHQTLLPIAEYLIGNLVTALNQIDDNHSG